MFLFTHFLCELIRFSNLFKSQIKNQNKKKLAQIVKIDLLKILILDILFF